MNTNRYIPQINSKTSMIEVRKMCNKLRTGYK